MPTHDPLNPSKGVAAFRRSMLGGRQRASKPVSLAGAGVRISFGEADNPYFSSVHPESGSNPRRIEVARNANESLLVGMEVRKTIDTRQALAGHRVRAMFERVAGGQRSSSFISERVDGGQMSGGITESRAQAALQLKQLADAIGMAPFRLLMLVCGEGRSLAEVTRDDRRRKGRVQGRPRCGCRTFRPWQDATMMRQQRAPERSKSIADQLDNLAGRLARLGPCMRDPERFHIDRERIAEDLGSLQAELARSGSARSSPIAPITPVTRSGYRVERGRVLPVISR